MSIIRVLPVILLVLSSMIHGCSCTPTLEHVKARGEQAQAVSEKQTRPLVGIKSIGVGPKEMRLAYRVTNPSNHDIWVAEDMGDYVREEGQTAELKIKNETLYVDFHVVIPPGWNIRTVFTRYCRIPPGQSRSKTMTLPVPLQSNSLERGSWDGSRVVRRVVLDLGYFEEDLPTLISESVKRGFRPREVHLFAWHPTSDDPDLAWVEQDWGGLSLEQSAQACFQGVNIPAAQPIFCSGN
jgi:hypothetical protein